jgi:hypothetical protein
MISVMLDDEAKEGLVYAMRRLNKNHADAARWLLASLKTHAMQQAFRCADDRLCGRWQAQKFLFL